MLEEFAALQAFAECGKMIRAAHRLHISQSAVSKRIKKLEAELGRKLLEPKGRKVILSCYAENLLSRVKPALSDLKHAMLEETSGVSGQISIVASQIIMISWGAKVLAKLAAEAKEVSLEVHSAYQYSAIEQVRSGEKMLALVHANEQDISDLRTELIGAEEMVLVPSGLKAFKLRRNMTVPLIANSNPTGGGWEVMRPLQAMSSRLKMNFPVIRSYESSIAVIQMARAGFGNCIQTASLAAVVGIKRSQLVRLPKPGIQKPVVIVARASTLSRPAVRHILDKLKVEVARELGD